MSDEPPIENNSVTRASTTLNNRLQSPKIPLPRCKAFLHQDLVHLGLLPTYAKLLGLGGYITLQYCRQFWLAAQLRTRLADSRLG